MAEEPDHVIVVSQQAKVKVAFVKGKNQPLLQTHAVLINPVAQFPNADATMDVRIAETLPHLFDAPANFLPVWLG